MKIGGWILLVIAILSAMGILLRGGNLIGPVFWGGLGIYLIHRSDQKKKEQEEKDNWINGKQK